MSLTGTQLAAGGDIGLHANSGLLIVSVQADAGGGLAATASHGGLTATGARLTAKGMLDLASREAQQHIFNTYDAGAMSLYTESGTLALYSTTLQTHANQVAGLGEIEGKLSLESGGGLYFNSLARLAAATDLTLVTGNGDLTVKPANWSGGTLSANQISVGRDLTLAARHGNLILDGGVGGNGSGVGVDLYVPRNLALLGDNISMKGGRLFARTIDLTATSGDIRIDAIPVASNQAGYDNTYWISPWLYGTFGIDLQAAGDIELNSVFARSHDTLSILSGGNLTTTGEYNRRNGNYDGWYKDEHTLARGMLYGNRGVTLGALGGHLTLNATDVIAASGTARLQALGDIVLEAAQEHRLHQTQVDGRDCDAWGIFCESWTTYYHRETLTAKPVTVTARDIELKAGNDIDTYATRFNAGGNLTLEASDAIHYYAVYDQQDNAESRTSKSSLWGNSYSKSNESNSRSTLTGQATQLQSQQDILSRSGGDQLLQGTQVSYGGTARFQAGVGEKPRADARILLEGLKHSVSERRTLEAESTLWQQRIDQGSVIETLTLPSFSGPGQPRFEAPGGLDVQLPGASEFKTQIASLASQPGLAYLDDLAQRTDVNWQPIKLAHDQWNYEQEGLTGAGAALLAVVVAWATAGLGAGANLIGAEAGTTTALMADAAFTSLASQAAISFVNNKGDLGKTLKDLGRKDSVKATLAAMLTAGALSQIGGLDSVKELKSSTAFGDQLTYNLINAGGRALTHTAIEGGDLEDALKQAILGAAVDTLHGEAASKIKGLEAGYLAHKLAHALAGCAAGAAANGDCRDGAIGAAVGEVVADLFKDQKPGAYASEDEWKAYDAKVLAYSKIVAGAVSAYSGGDAQTAITTAETAVRNNFLTFDENQLRKQAAQACQAGNAQACADAKRWNEIDGNRDEKVRQVCAAAPGSQNCRDWRDFALLARASYSGQAESFAAGRLTYGDPADVEELQSIQKLLAGTPHTPIVQAPNPQLQALLGIIADLTPLVGDAKAFYEAENPFDYALAMIGALGPVGDGAAAAIRAAKVAHQAGDTAKATTQLKQAEKLIEANVGSKGNWSAGINGALEPHATYRLNNGHQYKTDTIGRVATVEGDLSRTVMDRNKYQQCVTGNCGEIDDQGGHLIAATLGGAGDRINLVPQAATLNNGAWKAMENEFKAALDAGRQVSVKIEVGYPAGGGVRPSSFLVRAVIDGQPFERRFVQ